MKEIALENFRCFHTKQTARLAPLTLLVGDNSTGKTSFLAVTRVLWDCVHGHQIPNFKEEPFDLGSFDEIAHRQSERNTQASTFEITVQLSGSSGADIVFGREGTVPVPVSKRLVDDSTWIKEEYGEAGSQRIQFGTSRGSWEVSIPTDFVEKKMPSILSSGWIGQISLLDLISSIRGGQSQNFIPIEGSPPFSKADETSVRGIWSSNYGHGKIKDRPFASAPVRSMPQRTYDPASITSDPEGDNVPMLLANLAYKKDAVWAKFKQKLERFGFDAGVFDEIDVKHLGKSVSAPFQIQIRKFGNKRKGPKQNLIDVGYGISQALPILTELLLPDISRMALLQQPEVHLHPSAQAALGTLFCEIAGQGRQLVVETHSDHLIDRISMDVRDGKTNLKPEDVSILFFERNDTSVQIHSIRLDKEGNVRGAPDSYRRFFMEETTRSLGF